MKSKRFRSCVSCLLIFGIIQSGGIRAQNLIPDKPVGPVYNYFCTWAIQNYLYGWGKDPISLDSVISHNRAAEFMNESRLTVPENWLSFYPEVRGDLIFLLDEGYNTQSKDAMEVDETKFPSFTGTPEERQKKLADLVARAGWYGLGLWSRGIKPTPEALKRVSWSKKAGVRYWKIDGGDKDCIYDSLRNENYPGLIIEHGESPKVSVIQ